MGARRKRVTKSRRDSVSKAVSLYKPMAEALDALCEKYDVALSAVVRKFCEDGVRKIADEQRWPELLSIAGLEERKPNPFNALEGNTYTPCAPAYVEQLPVPTFSQIPEGSFLLPTGAGSLPAQESE